MLSDLPKIHSFYKYSLDTFILVIHRAIDYISENKMFGEDTMCPYGDEENEDHEAEENDEEEAYEEAP